ncbi:MAG: hypothetical protein A2Z14_07160 [Chloroflexi bacterium RBG_16_48_8]|nr:MAG: hypothetical protein A2Z14_07160 [Chloroflexi bacterium RBG_16_48_8]
MCRLPPGSDALWDHWPPWDRCKRLQAIAVIHDSYPASYCKETGFEVGNWHPSQGHVQSLEKRGLPLMLISFSGNTRDHGL